MEFLIIEQVFGTFHRYGGVNKDFIVICKKPFPEEAITMIDRSKDLEYSFNGESWSKKQSLNIQSGWKAEQHEFSILSHKIVGSNKFDSLLLQIDVLEQNYIGSINIESFMRYEFISIEDKLIRNFVSGSLDDIEHRFLLQTNDFMFKSSYPYLVRKSIVQNGVEVHNLIDTNTFHTIDVSNEFVMGVMHRY